MANPRAAPCAEGVIQSARADRACAASAKPWVLVATILTSSIAYIDESVVNVALPAIETELATTAVVIQWLVNAYTLCLSAFLLVGGAAGDRFGSRRLLVIGMSVFAVSSLWCGLSPSIAQLISARAIQGFGAALLIPSSLALIGATFDDKQAIQIVGTASRGLMRKIQRAGNQESRHETRPRLARDLPGE
jgi:MFS family permease